MEALQLEVDDRAELAPQIVTSIDGLPDAEAESAWAVKIERHCRCTPSKAPRLLGQAMSMIYKTVVPETVAHQGMQTTRSVASGKAIRIRHWDLHETIGSSP